MGIFYRSFPFGRTLRRSLGADLCISATCMSSSLRPRRHTLYSIALIGGPSDILSRGLARSLG